MNLYGLCAAGLQRDTGQAAKYEGAEVWMQIAPSQVSKGTEFIIICT